MKDSFRNSLERLESEHWWYRARRTILQRALARLVGPEDRALTVGVGVAREAEMLSRCCRLMAIDKAPIDPACARFARAARADAVRLPFATGSFDAVFILDVIEHVEADDDALAEIRRVLRPGGALLVTAPAFMFLFGQQDVVSDHKRRYRRGQLVRQLESHGFSVEYATYFNTLLFPPIAATRLLMRLLPERGPSAAGDFDLRLPRPVERLLEWIFALEAHAIHRARLPFGVSLLSVARARPVPAEAIAEASAEPDLPRPDTVGEIRVARTGTGAD